MAKKGTVFTRDGARRIAEAVRRFEKQGAPPLHNRMRGPVISESRILLAKANEFFQAGESGSVTIMWDSDDPADYAPIGDTVEAFCRHGVVFNGFEIQIYEFPKHYEVLNPTLIVDGLTTGVINYGQTGSAQIGVWNGTGFTGNAGTITPIYNGMDTTVNLASGARVKCAWVGTLAVPGWDIIQSSYTCP